MQQEWDQEFDRLCDITLGFSSLSSGGLLDRRRPGQPHPDQAGAVPSNPATTTSSSSGKGMLFHSSGSKASQRHKHSSWQDLQEVSDDDAGDDVLTTADTNMAGGADSSSSGDGERAALLQRPATHVTLTVSRQGEDQAARQEGHVSSMIDEAGINCNMIIITCAMQGPQQRSRWWQQTS